MKNKEKFYEIIILSFLTIVAGVSSFYFTHYYYPLINTFCSSVLFVFLLYGLYLERFKPSLKYFIVISAVVNLLLIVLYFYVSYNYVGITQLVEFEMMVVSAVKSQTAAFFTTLLIRFFYRKFIRSMIKCLKHKNK